MTKVRHAISAEGHESQHAVGEQNPQLSSESEAFRLPPPPPGDEPLMLLDRELQEVALAGCR